jgi:ketose-bisphosphate aldolase
MADLLAPAAFGKGALQLGGYMKRLTTNDFMLNAMMARTVIPAFNIPYLPMMGPTVAALRDTESFGLIAVARLEWTKFEAGSLEAVFDEYQRVGDEEFVRLHLDHVPVIDEDNKRVEYADVIRKAIKIGYQSVMVDGSRLPLEANIRATRQIVHIAHAVGVAVEGELGAVFGHEDGPLPSYQELYTTGRGFTDPESAKRFVEETGVDWLSVAVGNIHGSISAVARRKKKVRARLNISHLDHIHQRVGIPLVLHGGSGIDKESLREAVRHGICKINIATATRQPFERALNQSMVSAQEATYEAVVQILSEELGVRGSRHIVNPVAG